MFRASLANHWGVRIVQKTSPICRTTHNSAICNLNTYNENYKMSNYVSESLKITILPRFHHHHHVHEGLGVLYHVP
jgi:hypothetical protein